MKFFEKIIRSGTGMSHKRFIAVLFSIVLVIFGFVLLFVEIKENNVPLFNQILYIFSGVILFQTGASVAEKMKKTEQKEKLEENNL